MATTLRLFLMLMLVASPLLAQDEVITDIHNILISPDGNKILIDAREGIFLYDSMLNLLGSVKNANPNVRFVIGAWSPDNVHFSVNNQIWDTRKLEPIRTFSQVYGLPGWSMDGKRLFTLMDGGQTIGIISADTGDIVRTIAIGFGIEFAKWSPDNRHFLTAAGNALVVIDADNINSVSVYHQPGYLNWASWSPKGDRIAYTYGIPVANGTTYRYGLRVADAKTGQILAESKPLDEDILEFIWSPDDNFIIGSTNHRTIIRWESRTMSVIDSFRVDGLVSALTVSRYGERLIFAPNRLIKSFQPDAAIGQHSNDFHLTKSYLNNAIAIIVPAPSLERLKSITNACGLQPNVQEALISQIDANDLNTFKTQVSALSSTDIPEGCQADLLAVADALLTK